MMLSRTFSAPETVPSRSGEGGLSTESTIGIARIAAGQFPINQAANAVALAMIVNLTGPSFRPVGSTMFVSRERRCTGSLSSGCIDADVALHAIDALYEGARILRYGEGSPFNDVRLPCGGRMDILVAPMPAARYARDLRATIAGRTLSRIMVNRDGLSVGTTAPPMLTVEIVPDPRFVVIGKGLEAAAFATLVNGAGYDTVLISPDAEQLTYQVATSLKVLQLFSPSLLKEVLIDAQTACVLFFHDHDYEPILLKSMLDTPAFYIGAQGSRRTASQRISRLRDLGVTDQETRRIRRRIRGPIGVVPSARDPRTLAVSVLAEVLMEAQQALL